MDARQLLYYSPYYDVKPEVPLLESAGWGVHLADTEEQALHIIEDEDIRVALVGMDAQHAPNSAGGLWAERDDVEWIALVPSDALHDEAITTAVASYFFDFHTLPADMPRLLHTLGHAQGMARILRNTTTMEPHFNDYEMVGASKGMCELFAAIRKVASVDAPILITGESGTGKELAARAIHERSSRAEGPFVAVNCAALPPTLIQSELFGHEKGAFTGAHQAKIGLIESAQGGTLFLDEIGDLPLDLQINLLRFLQERTIERIGGRTSQHVDARVIAATNVNLERAVSEGSFREDLYYRLHVLTLHVPPLRERADDVEVLAKFFFIKFAREHGLPVKGIGRRAMQALRDYSWPGNVRELINRMRRAVVMTDGRLITPEDLGLSKQSNNVRIMTLQQARVEAESDAINCALRNSHNNISAAARQLGVSRVTLYRLMEKNSITPCEKIPS